VTSGVLVPDAARSIPQIGTVRISALDTGGTFEVIEYVGPAEPPPHVHREREEAFFILEGTFLFTIGGQTSEAGPGMIALIPRGTEHSFSRSPGGRCLLIIGPAGLEDFFRELGDGLQSGRSGADIRAGLAGRYDSDPV